METRLEAANLAQGQGQEVEEERPLRLRGKRNHLALGLRVRLSVNVMEVRRLAAETGAVVDELYVYFAGGVIYKGHLLTVRTGGA